MNGHTQQAHQKIVTELNRILPAIIAEAVEKQSAPLTAEVENCRKLVNETNERATKEIQELKDTLSDKQNEIIGLREELKDAKSKIADAAARIGSLQAENERQKEEIELLSAKPKPEPVEPTAET